VELFLKSIDADKVTFVPACYPTHGRGVSIVTGSML